MNSQRQTQQPINVSLDQLVVPRNRTSNKTIIPTHKLLQKQNQILRKQLEHLSLKLDDQIRKRLKHQLKSQPVQETHANLQLINAYKKCDIYRKQANYYKKKYQSLSNGQSLTSNQNKIKQLIEEVSRLKGQIKDLKKINKAQEKGLIQLDSGNYIKQMAQKERLRQQVRILMRQLNQYHRNSTKSKQINRNSPLPKQPNQQTIQKKETIEMDIELVQKKWQKQALKNRKLFAQVQHLKQQNVHLKTSLQQKQKQIISLKQKNNSLRQNNTILQRQVASKNTSNRVDSNSRIKPRTKTQHSSVKRRVWKQSVEDSFQNSYVQNKQQNKTLKLNEISWSDQIFNSKIKQIQVAIGKDGKIRDIYARYLKGQGKKYEYNMDQRVQVLSCSQQQHIKSIEGRMKQGYLKNIRITTNMNRKLQCGQFTNQQGIQICFNQKQDNYLGALSGCRDQKGISRLSCMFCK